MSYPEVFQSWASEPSKIRTDGLLPRFIFVKKTMPTEVARWDRSSFDATVPDAITNRMVCPVPAMTAVTQRVRLAGSDQPRHLDGQTFPPLTSDLRKTR